MPSTVTQAPCFSAAEAASIAGDLFHVSGKLRQLPSERDQNFHIHAANHKEYVLKIANAAEKFEALDFQNQAMLHVQHHKNAFSSDAGICSEIVN